MNRIWTFKEKYNSPMIDFIVSEDFIFNLNDQSAPISIDSSSDTDASDMINGFPEDERIEDPFPVSISPENKKILKSTTPTGEAIDGYYGRVGISLN